MTRAHVRRAALGLLFFTAVALLGSPYFYDQGNSGRYLTGVLRVLDPSLFPGDPVVDGLAGFASLFYSGLGWLFRAARVPASALATGMFILYIVARIALMVALFNLVRTLTARPWVFLLVGAWAVHAKPLPLGGTQLFANTLRHTEIFFLVALVALACLGRGRPLRCGLLLALGVFIHALMALHLLLTLAPGLLLLAWRQGGWRGRRQVAGLGLVGAALLIYLGWLAPPPFTSDEAQIFLAAKGNVNHISYRGVSPLRWLDLLTLIALATAAFWTSLRPRREAAFMLGAVYAGTILALGLATAAIHWPVTTLAQVQPLRMILWVTFFAVFLIAWSAGQTWSAAPFLATLLLSYVVLAILDVYWRLAVAPLVIAWWAAPALARRLTRVRPATALVHTGRRWLVGGFGATLLVAAVAGPALPAGLGAPYLAGPALFLLLMGAWRPRRSAWRGGLALALLGFALVTASRAAYAQYTSVVDADWAAIGQWARGHSAPSDRFLVTYTAEPFRTRALRTAVSHNHSALAWVDPFAFAGAQAQAGRIQAGRVAGAWDVDYLVDLAAEMDADFVVVDGPYAPARSPVYVAGRFTVLAVTER